MGLIQDNALFADISREFAVRYVALMARVFHSEDLVSFDLHNITDRDRDLLSNLCFFGLVNFEEQSGFDGAGKTYTPRVAFETDKTNAEPTVLIGANLVHGLIEDDVLNAGIERARAGLVE